MRQRLRSVYPPVSTFLTTMLAVTRLFPEEVPRRRPEERSELPSDAFFCSVASLVCSVVPLLGSVEPLLDSVAPLVGLLEPWVGSEQALVCPAASRVDKTAPLFDPAAVRTDSGAVLVCSTAPVCSAAGALGSVGCSSLLVSWCT